jgi:DnaK suppressor protein
MSDRSAGELDLDQVRGLLTERLAEVRGQVADLTRPPEQGAAIGFGKRVGDGTTEAITRFTDVGIANNVHAIEQRIERALEKLDEGSYGVCDGCGEPIGAGRLQAEPASVLCIDCAKAS